LKLIFLRRVNIIDNKWEKIIEKCILIREFEKVIQTLYFSDCIQSPVHLSIGQELTSVLISEFYQDKDYVIGNYRSHGIALSLADDFKPLVLELLAKKKGVSGGKGGSMHLSVPHKNLIWTSAIVGSGVPIAMGMAEALKRNSKDNVASVMFGDGALEEGCVVECLNMSSVFKLPVVFILEDNGLAIHTSKSQRSGLSNYCQLPNAYGIKTFSGSYKDPINLDEIFSKAYNYSRKNRLPSFIQVKCYRWLEHVGVSEDWNLGYRDKKELEPWLDVDVIKNPKPLGVSIDFCLERESFYNRFFLNMFNDLKSESDPLASDLLSNVI